MATRGRPPIDEDQKSLQAVAMLLASGEAKTPRSAICRTVKCNDAAIRRLQRKWRRQGDDFLAAATAMREHEAARKAARESRPCSSGGGYGASYGGYAAADLARTYLSSSIDGLGLTESACATQLARQEQDLLKQALGVSADYAQWERELTKASLAELSAASALVQCDVATARDWAVTDLAHQAMYETQRAIDQAMDPLSCVRTELERLNTYSVASFDRFGKSKWW